MTAALPALGGLGGGIDPVFRLAIREMRGGMRGFFVFVACIALGVMAVAGVASLAHGLSDGLARQGRSILGGDVSFSLVQREASASERAFLAGHGVLSAAALMRAMARTEDGRSALVEVKAVDGQYPLYGRLQTSPDLALAEGLSARGDVFGAVVDPLLFTRFGLQPGARLILGHATLELRAALVSEPDKLAGGIAFGPRLLISQEALRATGLLQPGSLVRWLCRLRLADAAAAASKVDEVIAAAKEQLPQAGWEIRTSTNVSPQLERTLDRFTQYLTLVGLTALLVGGVGVANSTRQFVERRRDTLATMKALGASGSRVVAICLVQVLLIALLGVTIGLGAGAALPFAAAAAFGAIIPLPFAPAVYPAALLSAAAYGLLTAAAFAVWPLGRAHDVPVSRLFRDSVAPDRRLPRPRYRIAAAGLGLALASLALLAAYERRTAAIFIVAALAVLLMLRLLAAAVMAVARRLPRPRSTALRLALANVHRPGALTPTVVVSLGLGLALLVTVLEIDANLRRQFAAGLPAHAPSFYFLDIQSADAQRFDAFVRAQAPDAQLERVPMLRGRIVSVNGIDAENVKPRPDAAWVLQSDRGISYTSEIPRGSRVVEGRWWPADYRGPPLLSLEKKVADGLGVAVGDEITVNALGRNITARIANLRAVDWQSLGINFVLVYSPGAFAGAPHTHIATVTFAGATLGKEAALLSAVTDAFPGVTAVPVRDAIQAVSGVVMRLVMAVRMASSVTLLAAVLVLGGALAAGQHHRVYDAVLLKVLGARRRQVIAAYALEYILVALAAVLFGAAAGSLAAWRVVADVMTLPFAWEATPALIAAAFALLAVIGCGLIGTFAALGRKPGPVLRTL